MVEIDRGLIEDVRRTLADTASEISQAVSMLEQGDLAEVEALLGEARTRATITAERLERYLS